MVGTLPMPGFVKRFRKYRECKLFGHGGLQVSEGGSGCAVMPCDHGNVLPLSEPPRTLSF